MPSWKDVITTPFSGRIRGTPLAQIIPQYSEAGPRLWKDSPRSFLVRPQHAVDELKTQSLFSTYVHNVFSAYDLLQV